MCCVTLVDRKFEVFWNEPGDPATAVMLYQEARQRGRLWLRPEPTDDVQRRCARRTRSEDSRAGGNDFIEETLEEVRRKRRSSSARLTDTEIDQLLADLRREERRWGSEIGLLLGTNLQ